MVHLLYAGTLFILHFKSAQNIYHSSSYANLLMRNTLKSLKM